MSMKINKLEIENVKRIKLKNRQKNEFEDNIWRESERSREALFILLKIAPAQPEKV